MTLPASSYAHIRQIVWVQKGSLVIDEAGERQELGAGDCLGFGPPADTTFANETTSPCVYVVRWPGAECDIRTSRSHVAPLSSPEIRAALSEMLIETVANGGSVSFMHPLAPRPAAAFWTDRSPPPTAASGWCSARWTAKI